MQRLGLLLFSSAFVLSDAIIFAQVAMPNNLRAASTIDRISGFQGKTAPDFLYGIPYPPGKVIGDTYLDANWKNSIIQLYENDKIIEGYQTRYDIQLNEIEVKSGNDIKVSEGNIKQKASYILIMTRSSCIT